MARLKKMMMNKGKLPPMDDDSRDSVAHEKKESEAYERLEEKFSQVKQLKQKPPSIADMIKTAKTKRSK